MVATVSADPRPRNEASTPRAHAAQAIVYARFPGVRILRIGESREDARCLTNVVLYPRWAGGWAAAGEHRPADV